MSIPVKAFLVDGEIRRFQLPVDVSTSYEYLKSKICDVFPSLGGGNFCLFWQDNDGDKVRFSSDDELMMAMAERPDETFRVYIQVVDESHPKTSAPTSDEKPTPNQKEGPTHPHVTCDVCENGIFGTRYKCCICPDFDLCSGCEQTGVHSEHMMMRMVKPMPDFGTFAGHFASQMGPFFAQFGGGGGGRGRGRGGPYCRPENMRHWFGGCPRSTSGCHGKTPGQSQSGPQCGPQASGSGSGCHQKQSEPQQSGAESEPQPQTSGAGAEQPGGSAQNDPGNEFLKHLGEGLSNMLGSFGVDVHYDIEHNGPRYCPQGRCPTQPQSTPAQTDAPSNQTDTPSPSTQTDAPAPSTQTDTPSPPETMDTSANETPADGQANQSAATEESPDSRTEGRLA